MKISKNDRVKTQQSCKYTSTVKREHLKDYNDSLRYKETARNFFEINIYVQVHHGISTTLSLKSIQIEQFIANVGLSFEIIYTQATNEGGVGEKGGGYIAMESKTCINKGCVENGIGR